MDAKVDDWVVTPRRGKAVEINALWYNALRLLSTWLRDLGRPEGTGDVDLDARAERVQRAFNDRFWYAEGTTFTTSSTANTGTMLRAGPTRCLRSRSTTPYSTSRDGCR
jgi:predicted glycogen debranching enzyme